MTQVEEVPRFAAKADQGMNNLIQLTVFGSGKLLAQHSCHSAPRGLEALPQGLDQTAVRHAARLVEQPGSQIRLGSDGEKRAQPHYPVVDQRGDLGLPFSHRLLGGDDHIEDGIVDDANEGQDQSFMRRPDIPGKGGNRDHLRLSRRLVETRKLAPTQAEYVVRGQALAQQVARLPLHAIFLRRVGQRLKVAHDAVGRRHELFVYRLDQVAVGNHRDLGQQTRRVIGRGLDLEQMLRPGDAAVDQLRHTQGRVARDRLAAHDGVERGVVDQRLQRLQRLTMDGRQVRQGVAHPRPQGQPAFDHAIQVRKIFCDLGLQGLQFRQCRLVDRRRLQLRQQGLELLLGRGQNPARLRPGVLGLACHQGRSRGRYLGNFRGDGVRSRYRGNGGRGNARDGAVDLQERQPGNDARHNRHRDHRTESGEKLRLDAEPSAALGDELDRLSGGDTGPGLRRKLTHGLIPHHH